MSPKPIHHEEREGHEVRKKNRHRAICLHELHVLHGLHLRSKSTHPYWDHCEIHVVSVRMELYRYLRIVRSGSLRRAGLSRDCLVYVQ